MTSLFFAEIQQIISDIMNMINQIISWLATARTFAGTTFSFAQAAEQLVQFRSTMLTPLTENVLAVLEQTSLGALWFIVVLVAVYYFLAHWPGLRDGFIASFPPQYQPEIEQLYQHVRAVWINYLRGQILLMLIVIFGTRYLLDIPTDPPVPNEFSLSRPNSRGTIAMAKLGGDPDGATSQWFINVDDNPPLDDRNNNGGYTVFGEVLAGMNIVEAIASLNVVYLGPLNSNDPSDDGDFSYPAFSELPVLNNYDSVIRPKPKPLPQNLVFVTRIPNVKSISTIWGTSAIFTAEPDMTFSFVGTSDLALDMGCARDGPEIRDALVRILEAGKKSNVAVGTAIGAVSDIEKLIDLGLAFYLISHDQGMPPPACSRAPACAIRPRPPPPSPPAPRR